MKYLLVLIVVWLGWHLLVRQRSTDATDRPPTNSKPAAPPAPQQMVACQRCGTHLPLGDALPGRTPGVYFCCAEHRDTE